MLVIRQSQKQVLQKAARQDFVTRMLAHIREFFPQHCEKLGDDGCHELIELAIERAGRHGFNTERQVCKYVNLMLSFGVEFDEDPAHPWARDVLERYRKAPRVDCMQALYDAAQAAADKAAKRQSGG